MCGGVGREMVKGDGAGSTVGAGDGVGSDVTGDGAGAVVNVDGSTTSGSAVMVLSCSRV